MYSSGGGGGGGGGGGRMSFDRGFDYEHGRAASMDYDRGDRGGGGSSSDPYARVDTNTVFVRYVRSQWLLTCRVQKTRVF